MKESNVRPRAEEALMFARWHLDNSEIDCNSRAHIKGLCLIIEALVLRFEELETLLQEVINDGIDG